MRCLNKRHLKISHESRSRQDVRSRFGEKGRSAANYPPSRPFTRNQPKEAALPLSIPFQSSIPRQKKKKKVLQMLARSLAGKMQCKVKKSCVHRLMYNAFLILNQLPASVAGYLSLQRVAAE
jgi:hypothetical protein